MTTPADKFILLGVTGGIAAYKSAELCSKLCQHGYTVQVVMTENAQRFVTPLTFQCLSRNRVITSLWEEHDWRPEHVALTEKAQLLLIAPCTANMIGKIAHGIADDALSTFALTHRGQILLAPAMNPAMWICPAFQDNMAILKQRGVQSIGPDAGHVACGNDGVGRMAEPSVLFDAVEAFFRQL